MKDRLDVAKDTLGRIAALFLILWFITAVTDILGDYEYEVEFLQVAVGFHLLSRIPTAFRHRYTTGKKAQKLFTNVGWSLIGLWIAFIIFRWIGWFGAMEIGVNIDYFLVFGAILLLLGYAAKSLRYKAKYWAARSVLFAVGGVSFLFWILIKVFDIFPQYEDYALVVGIAAIGIGYILGGMKRPPGFYVDISDEEEEEPEIGEEVYVTDDDVSLSRGKAHIKIAKGSLFVPITTGREIGGIYFGEGSYTVDATVKVYQDVYRGVTVVAGREWNTVKGEQVKTPADEKAFEDIGLKKEEVLEIARLQVKGKVTDEVKKRLKQTQIDLPFVKVRETPHGDYIKVGPIEVQETGDEEHVRIGPWEFKETKYKQRLTRSGLFIQIRSKNEDITIHADGKTVFEKGGTRVVVNDKIAVKSDDIDLVMDETKKILHAGDIALVCKDYKRVLRSKGFELIVKEDSGTIKKNGKSATIDDEKTLAEIRTEIDAVADELIKEVLDRGELKELDALIKKFEQELS